MTDDENKIPQRGLGDYAHTAAKAALSAIPVIGGPAAELFALVLAPPIEKRRDSWLQRLYDGFKSLEAEVEGFNISDLSEDEEFVSSVLHATQIAMRTHQEEKLQALRNALLNVIRLRRLDEEAREFFFGLIDLFSVTHLEVIRLFKDRVSFSPIRRQQLQDRRSLTDPVVLDLNLRNLLKDPRPIAARNRESSEPLVCLSWELSDLGQQFIKFISNDGFSAR